MRPFTSEQRSFNKWIALFAAIAIVAHLALTVTAQGRLLINAIPVCDWPTLLALVVGGIPLIFGLIAKCLRLHFGADLLAGLSIITALMLGEYLAGALVVLMLSGGEAIETLCRAEGVLRS